MAKNLPAGDNHRVSAVGEQPQTCNPQNHTWVKCDTKTGRFFDQKAELTPFKGVRKEK